VSVGITEAVEAAAEWPAIAPFEAIPREANAAELLHLLPSRHSGGAEQFLWFGERGTLCQQFSKDLPRSLFF
jgi:hypothetical protein